MYCRRYPQAAFHLKDNTWCFTPEHRSQLRIPMKAFASVTEAAGPWLTVAKCIPVSVSEFRSDLL
jgi:hypothetical protein